MLGGCNYDVLGKEGIDRIIDKEEKKKREERRCGEEKEVKEKEENVLGECGDDVLERKKRKEEGS